jgi:hypothetical protein
MFSTPGEYTITMTPQTPSTGRARVLFWLAVANLLAVAGLIHRSHWDAATEIERAIILTTLAFTWPLIVLDVFLSANRRTPELPRRRVIRRAILVSLFPPLRLSLPHPATNEIWLPRLGWQPPGKRLLRSLDRGFNGPMLVFALLILPVLIIEYTVKDMVTKYPAFNLAMNIVVAIIWVAFAIEYILKSSAAPHPWRYVRARWVDLAIVVLPIFEFALTFWANSPMLARLLRLTRATDQLARYGRLYRLQGVFIKGWYALMSLEAISRLFGGSPEKRLRQLDAQIADMEEDLAELREQAHQLRQQISAKPTAEQS